jgi:hypothetical protein
MSEEQSSMSDYLLVPTNLQAFMVGKPGEQVYDLAPVPQTEDDVAKWYVQSKYRFSFQSSKLTKSSGEPYSLGPGVHLHWALPAALMHSRHQGTGEPKQPCIPNRWLVLRMWHAAGDSKISSKAWVVESDYIADKAESGSTPFLFFSPSLELKYVGRAKSVEGWIETNPEYRFELKSFGWGDPSFAAFYPACRGVLGFHDKLEDLNQGDLTYLVIGWYSDPVRDPLRPASGSVTEQACTERLASLGWSCPNLGSGAPPQRTLYNGGVVGVNWQGPDQKYPLSPVGTSATVAIGGSAAEAVAALLARDNDEKSLQQVLCAFQHGQATQVSELDQLGDLLHRHGFGAMPGGEHWSIEPIPRPADAQSSSPPISEQVQDLLGRLNEAQQALDRHTRKIESLRVRLFSCWATWASKQKGPPTGRPNRSLVDSAAEDLQTATAELEYFEKKVKYCKDSVTEALKTEKTGMQLAESTMPPFLYPKDPFLVLKGDGLVGVDRARAQRREKDAAGLLHCRLTKDVVTGVRQSGTISKEWLAKNCFTLNFPHAAGVPPGEVARKLALETLLFDPYCASLIETEDPELFETLQKSLDQSRKSDSSGNKLTWKGRPPDPLGITHWCGSNPWVPVYLMWQARWRSAYAPVPDSDNSHSGALAGWELDSDRARPPNIPFDPLSGDLIPRKGSLQPKDDILLEGATIISALSATQLAKNLSEFAKTEGRNTDNLERITQTQVLGQSLGGLNELLLRQSLGLCLSPVDPISKQVDTAVWEAMGQVPQPSIPVAGSFLPVRAGALKLVNLYIVDSFGQTRKLIDSASSSTAQPRIIASAVLPKAPPGYHAGFSPRLAQPARLNFDWQPAEDTDSSGPVCGWIVANFLEKSFAVFSAGGVPLGALESVLPAFGEKTINSKVTFKWRPIPGSTLAIEGIGNEQLRRFVGLVTTFTADEGQAFLELVDLVLRRTEARLPPEDPDMTVLLGRPLALAHASLGLEVQGLPSGYWNDQTWTFVTEGFEKLRVLVRLGGMNLPSDGLVGYLPENGKPCFFASEGATRRISGSSRIEYDQELKVACAAEPVRLTLLMDASAQVHATTGILPRHRISLPAEVVRQVGLIEEFYFGVAPVLGERSRQSLSQPTMPKPSDAFGQWSWATRPDLTGQTQIWREIRAADDRACFADDLALTEGWLRLRRNQDVAAPDKET